MQSQAKEPLSQSEPFNIPGRPQGKWAWPIRIGSFLIFLATLLTNYLVGVQTGTVSRNYHLYVTPPGLFFSIWAVIYTALIVVNIYNLVKNEWTKEVHLWFTFSNIANALWICIFNIGNDPAVFACSFILLSLVPFILKTWYALGNRPEKSFNAWTYITRNVFAFYLGWVIAAANINLGFMIVFWWGASKQTQLAIFWVMAPLCAIGATAFNYVQEGKRGLLSCFMLWASVIWAFVGAAITSHGCLSKTLTLC